MHYSFILNCPSHYFNVQSSIYTITFLHKDKKKLTFSMNHVFWGTKIFWRFIISPGCGLSPITVHIVSLQQHMF